MPFLIRLSICFILVGLCTYHYLGNLNHLISLRLKLPVVERKLSEAKTTHDNLSYRLSEQKSPERLEKLRQDPRFSHLHTPSPSETTTYTSYESPTP